MIDSIVEGVAGVVGDVLGSVVDALIEVVGTVGDLVGDMSLPAGKRNAPGQEADEHPPPA